jgi:Asp-tRNA(Asn)/Glu-tRNA(Gln) amidotransferase A subunit family amidase
MTAVAGIAGAPAVSAPALTVDGAPVGVCLVGAPGSDVALVDLAVALVG